MKMRWIPSVELRRSSIWTRCASPSSWPLSEDGQRDESMSRQPTSGPKGLTEMSTSARQKKRTTSLGWGSSLCPPTSSLISTAYGTSHSTRLWWPSLGSYVQRTIHQSITRGANKRCSTWLRKSMITLTTIPSLSAMNLRPFFNNDFK